MSIVVMGCVLSAFNKETTYLLTYLQSVPAITVYKENYVCVRSVLMLVNFIAKLQFATSRKVGNDSPV